MLVCTMKLVVLVYNKISSQILVLLTIFWAKKKKKKNPREILFHLNIERDVVCNINNEIIM